MSQTHLWTHLTKISWNELQAAAWALRALWTGRTRQDGLTYSRGEDPLIFYGWPDVSRGCFFSFWRILLSVNPSSSNPAWPLELSKYLKSSGTWCIRKYYFNIKSPSTLEPKHYKTPIQLSCAGRQPDEAKGLNIQMSILEFQHVHGRQKQTCLELCDMFEVFCHSHRAACMICTSARIRPRPVRHPLHMSPEDLRPQLSPV